MSGRPYAEIWRRALPYLGVRQNAEHTRYSFRFAERLGPLCGAEAEVVLPAIILHDVGWSTVPEDRILESLGPGAKYPELRRRHEIEGARLAGEILAGIKYSAARIDAITTIIDGHDTREAARSVDDAVVKDVDKLWRYTAFGLATVRRWFGHDEGAQLALLGQWAATRLFTEPARLMAAGLLVALRAEHQPAPPA